MFSPGTTGARGLRLYQLGSFTVVGCRPEMAAGPRGQRSLSTGAAARGLGLPAAGAAPDLLPRPWCRRGRRVRSRVARSAAPRPLLQALRPPGRGRAWHLRAAPWPRNLPRAFRRTSWMLPTCIDTRPEPTTEPISLPTRRPNRRSRHGLPPPGGPATAATPLVTFEDLLYHHL